MPATTTNGAPYPLGTDPISDGDDSIKNLAQFVDDKLFCFGAMTRIPSAQLGAGAIVWATDLVSVKAAGGMTLAADGMTVPVKGFYQFMAVTHMTTVNADGPVSTFVGDGTNSWAIGNAFAVQAAAWGATPVAMSVRELTAGTKVKWGFQASGSAGTATIYGGAEKSMLMVRLILPTT